LSRDLALPCFALQAMRLVGAVRLGRSRGAERRTTRSPVYRHRWLRAFAIGVLLFFAGPVGLARKWKKWGKGPE
jgi:Na+-transporting NADH:ubiquinone oxidoreductase subunit NqrB